MRIESTIFDDAYVIHPDVFGDARGYFKEVYHKAKFHGIGFASEFVQDNMSYSEKGVLRGLHFQWNPHQGKLVRVMKGIVYDVIVDIKRDSPSFGNWLGVELSDENHKMLWVPPGYAHSFLVLSENAIVEYKCSGLYNNIFEGRIRYDDPEIGIQWPVDNVLVSGKDQGGISLSEWKNSPDFVVFNDTLPPVMKLHTDL